MFMVKEYLDQGAFGKVFDCVDRQDGQHYTVKVTIKNLKSRKSSSHAIKRKSCRRSATPTS
jgi:hypothetical protein